LAVRVVDGTGTHPHSATCAHSYTTAATATAPAGATPFGFAPITGTRRAGRPLPGYFEVRRYRLKAQGLPNEIAKRDDEFVRMDRLSGNKLADGMIRQTDLGFGPEQYDVRQGGFNRIPYPSGAVRPGSALLGQFLSLFGFSGPLAMASPIPQMGWIDCEIACERPSQCLVGCDQDAKALVYLPVHPFATLLDRHHHQQADTDADQRKQRQADQRDEHAMP
jgi:hypothetical protein